MRNLASVVISSLMLAAGQPVDAQTNSSAAQTIAPAPAQAPVQTAAPPTSPETSAPGKMTAAQLRDAREARYRISQMERVLEGAVEHGATLIRERLQAAFRLQAAMPAQMLISENARVRGFRLEGYGVFFDVEVPTLTQTAFLSSVRTLDQNDLGLDRALRLVRKYIDDAGDTNVQQALKRIELQLAPPPIPVAQSAPPAAPGDKDINDINSDKGVKDAAGVAPADDQPPPDPILNDPDEAYRTEVKNQIVDTMLNFVERLAIGPNEWLTVGARRHDDRPIFAPADSDAGTMLLRVRGSDLSLLRSGALSREEALKRVEVRVF